MMDYAGMYKTPVVLSENVTRVHSLGFVPGVVDIINCLNEEQLEDLKEDREPFDAPSFPTYITPRPDKLGKLIWFSGPPGAGKSTSAQLLARNHGYVYYEADCLSIFVNPFIDIFVDEPSMAQMNQKPLKGLDQDAIRAIDSRSELGEVMMTGNLESG